ncbi:hypothetical protein [Azospirillum sp. B4]|uniref:hypothetical protein n=1 Tax=Azospirillum sp. B4 TaxID=95605 RepID=UPI0011DC9E6F|nr:hypothetical protein [Azospirillum sp. B4]
MTDSTRKIEAVKAAQESTKQIVTLSSAIIVSMLGFLSLSKIDMRWGGIPAILSVILISVSVGSGVISLYSLSGILSNKSHFEADVNILDYKPYKIFGRLQFLTFCTSILLLIIQIAVQVLYGPVIDGSDLILKKYISDIETDLRKIHGDIERTGSTLETWSLRPEFCCAGTGTQMECAENGEGQLSDIRDKSEPHKIPDKTPGKKRKCGVHRK